jgi:molybdenum cofactor cytidylyltransferase
MNIKLIYLAAGNSRRFGSNKLFCKVKGQPMYQYGLTMLLEVLNQIPEASLRVVTAFPEIRKFALDKERRFPGRIEVVDSPEREKGISYSIRAGLDQNTNAEVDDMASYSIRAGLDTVVYTAGKTESRKSPEITASSGATTAAKENASDNTEALTSVDYYLFCVADQPWVKAETVIKLLNAVIDGGFVGGYVEWEGTSGNPAVFSRSLLPDLLSLTGDCGGKKILRGRTDICTVQAREELELRDIDCIENLISDCLSS